MALCQVFRDLIVFYKADQLNGQTVALLTKYLLYHRTRRAVAVDQSFGARNLTHSSAKSEGYFGDPLLFLNQPPHVSKPQPPVGLFRRTFWYRNPVGNPPHQNFLGTPFEDSLLQGL